MNVFKYIKISFVLFFIFTIGENAYSQREIQPFENQFTYDYALKYYGNLNMKNSLKNNWYALYFFLENFKASPGIKHIEEGNMAYLDDVHYKYSSKRNYYYNEQGFLNKIVMITWVKNNDDQQFIKTEKITNEFEYKFTKEMIFIKNKDLTRGNCIYVFDKNKKQLIQMININKHSNDTIFFQYSDKRNSMVTEVKGKGTILTFSNDEYKVDSSTMPVDYYTSEHYDSTENNPQVYGINRWDESGNEEIYSLRLLFNDNYISYQYMRIPF